MNASRITSRISGIAMLALAALPMAALTTAARAAEHVRTADLNLASPTGRAIFDQRVDHAAKHLCGVERSVTTKAACHAAVHAEANEKAAATVQFASRV